MSLALTIPARGPDLQALAAGFAARAGTHDREASFPHENFAALQDAGLLALTVPRANKDPIVAEAPLPERFGVWPGIVSAAPAD